MYNRLFTKILDSSIWLEPTATRIVWVTLIAAMDEDGYAHFSAVENLANRARVTLEEAEKAIECFLAPDENSANPENEGRRIERVPGGFFILNAPEHRQMLNREIQREQIRLRVQRHRDKQSCNNSSVTSALPSVTPASASESGSASSKGEARGKQEAAEEIYQAYPKKVGKPFALKSILRAMATRDPAFLLERTKAFAAARGADLNFVPHPSTWFNQERFNDDPSTWVNDSDSRPAKPKSKIDEEYDEWTRKKNAAKK